MLDTMKIKIYHHFLNGKILTGGGGLRREIGIKLKSGGGRG